MTSFPLDAFRFLFRIEMGLKKLQMKRFWNDGCQALVIHFCLKLLEPQEPGAISIFLLVGKRFSTLPITVYFIVLHRRRISQSSCSTTDLWNSSSLRLLLLQFLASASNNTRTFVVLLLGVTPLGGVNSILSQAPYCWIFLLNFFSFSSLLIGHTDENRLTNSSNVWLCAHSCHKVQSQSHVQQKS